MRLQSINQTYRPFNGVVHEGILIIVNLLPNSETHEITLVFQCDGLKLRRK